MFKLFIQHKFNVIFEIFKGLTLLVKLQLKASYVKLHI